MSEQHTEVVEIDKSEGATEEATMDVVEGQPDELDMASGDLQDDMEDGE